MKLLCRELDKFHYQLFQTHKDTLKSPPELGFLSVDCYTPHDAEECLLFITRTLDCVHFIIGQLQTIPAKLSSEYLNKLNDFHKKIQSVLDEVNDSAPLISDLKKYLTLSVKVKKPPILGVTTTPRTFPYYIDRLIKVYGIVHKDGSLSEEKLFFIEQMVQRLGCSNEKKFHSELQEFIIKHYPNKILDDIPDDADEALFKKIIKEYSTLPRKGINNEAIFQFLKHYIFMYRWGFNNQPLEILIQNLEESPFKFLHKNIRDEAYKSRRSDL